MDSDSEAEAYGGGVRLPRSSEGVPGSRRWPLTPSACLYSVLAGARRTFALVFQKQLLAQPDALRCYFNQLVVVDKLQRLFQ
jgi:hypothetical protein